MVQGIMTVPVKWQLRFSDVFIHTKYRSEIVNSMALSGEI